MCIKKPLLLFFAGPNGSGKSTITSYFELAGTYTNADEVVATTGMKNEDAAVFVDNMRYESINKKEDFSFETVLSSEYKLDIIKKAKENDYFIKGVFVLTSDPVINVSRVKMRVFSGGHDVDSVKIRNRYSKSLENIKILMDLCDILHIYDNTVEPFRIVRKHKNDIKIFENDFWSAKSIKQLIGLN